MSAWWSRTFPALPPVWFALPVCLFFLGGPLWVVVVGMVTR
jgi:uncharacterized membrane protein